METKFKTLVYGGKEDYFYVKPYDLHEDVRPILYPVTYPIKFELDDVKAQIIRIYNVRSIQYNMNTIIRNINKCKLITIEITATFD